MNDKYKGMADKGDYTEQDLDCIIEMFLEYKKIMENPELVKLVGQHLAKKEKAISSLKELRKTASDAQWNKV